MYDTDVTTFSPAGRLHQVEYAVEAIKQGAACVGLRSKEYALLATLKRSPSELASYQQKMFKIDDHIGIAISGLIADARVLSEWMRNECLNHKYVYETALQSSRLVSTLSDKCQVLTQKSEKRPYGVGFLFAAYDSNGPHIYQTQPTGNWWEYKAQAMGARSQSAKTYLERKFESFESASLDELIVHSLESIKGSSQGPLTSLNVSVGYVGKDSKWTELTESQLESYIKKVSDDNQQEDEKEEKKNNEDQDMSS